MGLFGTYEERKIPRWYAYIHANGNLLLKRYFMPDDLSDAKNSPFVMDITPVIKAHDRKDAMEQAIDYFKNRNWKYTNKKFHK